MNRLAGGVALSTTLLTSIGLLGQNDNFEPEVRRVNEDDALLAYWPSEDFNSDEPPECNFFNFSFVYTSELCTHFVLTRASSTPRTAFERATKCAGLHQTECILSPEIGLSIPAAFLVPATGKIRMIVAPRLLPLQNAQTKHIRVHHPLETTTRTLQLNSTVMVEFMDGHTRAVRQELIEGIEAYCVQLLRLAFVQTCWHNLD
jgi:hypothetical protein